MKVQKICFQTYGDDQGTLVAIEECRDIPFDIKRVYYMYGTGVNVTRGHHAHKSLQQVLICVHGHCRVRLDDGKERNIFLLDCPAEGLYISKPMWREIFDFSPDAVLMVLASEHYNESDYIRDYEEFLQYVKERQDDE